jgi:hypothetical protein
MKVFTSKRQEVEAIQFNSMDDVDELMDFDPRIQWLNSKQNCIAFKEHANTFPLRAGSWFVKFPSGQAHVLSDQQMEDGFEIITASKGGMRKKKSEPTVEKPDLYMPKAVRDAVNVPGIPEDMLGGEGD